MFGKIIIHTDLKVLTGLHIGGTDAFAAIGAISSPVIRDKRTQYPIVPGSSLKGKLRTLLVRSMQQMDKLENDPANIKHLFGSMSPITYSRLQFADAFLKNKDEFKSVNDTTEAKSENTINRTTCQATPRQIERVVSGAVFSECIVYNEENVNETISDMELLAKGMKLLQLDYLGGYGTRGSGRVSFENFDVKAIDSETNTVTIEKLFKDVENYELLSI